MSDEILAGIITMLREGPLDLTAEPGISRSIFEEMFVDIPRPEGLVYEKGSVGGIAGLWIKPESAPTDEVILYMHGGAYVIGSTQSYESTMGVLAAASGVNLFAPEYRLAPEYPFPAAPDDILAAYQGLLENNEYKAITLAGDSAGGGLVMALLSSLKSADLPLPVGSLLWSPWLNLVCDSDSIRFNADNDPTLDSAGLLACVKHYLGESSEFIPADARLQPLEADLSGLPPLMIQVGSIEILLDDATHLASVAGAAGVKVRLDIYPDMPHVFPSFSPMLAEATQALEDAAHFIQTCAGR